MDNIANCDLLDASAIRQGITPEILSKLGQLTLLQETGSTNTAVLNLPADNFHAHVVLAERQNEGRGRRQKSWHSPAGGNVYFSLGWRFHESARPPSTLPLVVAVAVCRALSRTGLQGHGIKWPNDILAGGKKLAGILVELKSSGSGLIQAVIGVGLNVRMPASGLMIDRPWTDLVSEIKTGGEVPGRNRLVSLLIEELLAAMEDFELNGFPAFSKAWKALDLLHNRSIRLEYNGEQISGRATGVDGDGALLLKTASDTRAFHSGEVSVHYD